MNIVNKIPPLYLDCMSGLCEHGQHRVNSLWWIIPAVVMSLYIARKFKKII